MSNWTHVSGTIRINAIRGRLENNVNFDTLIGKECLWESEMEVWEDVEKNPKAYLPMGSEGSLQKLVWINPDEESVDACVVTIFGDLRSHDSAGSIIEWFEAKCKEINNNNGEPMWVRQATITANNEWYGTQNWTYKEPEEIEEIQIGG